MSLQGSLQYLGAFTAAITAYKALSFINFYLKPSKLSLYLQQDNNNTATSWALVTGSTNGIGEGFAHALCEKGFNVLLHGRSQQKLDTLKETLTAKYPLIKVETVTADAFAINTADIDAIVAKATSLPGTLRILVNNVGGSIPNPFYGSLTEVDANYIDNMINLNARFPSQITRAILPTFRANTSPTLILNVCSLTGFKGLPYLTTYSASKAFNYTFSEALALELVAENQSPKIEVLGIVVANVQSGGNKSGPGVFTCNSREMAEEALGRVGCGSVACFGWWRHAVQWAMVSRMPVWLVEKGFIAEMRGRKAEDEKDA